MQHRDARRPVESPAGPRFTAGGMRWLLLLPGLAFLPAAAGPLAGGGEPPAAEAPGDIAPPSGTETPGGEVPPPPATEPEVHPDVVSRYHVRVYRIKPKKLWKGLLETLESRGFPPEEVDAEGLTVKTSFVDFDQAAYSEQVAEPPPQMGPRYPIVQMVKVKEGKVSLDAALARRGRGTELRLRARLLVQGVDRRRRIRVLTDRRSSGIIEEDFLRVLEDTLGLERIVDGS